jgi:lipopolysaccharide export system protein LptC
VSRSILFINLSFLIILVISAIAIRQFMHPSKEGTRKSNPHRMDAYMVNAFFFKTNEEGQRELTLSSPYVTHYPLKDSSTFQKPVIYIYKEGAKWQVTANHANGEQGASTFYLWDNVKVKRLPSHQNTSSLLLTHSLRVFPKENVVTTQDVVTILQPGLKIKAVGLEGNLKTGNIKLLSKTRGEYDPKLSHTKGN